MMSSTRSCSAKALLLSSLVFLLLLGGCYARRHPGKTNPAVPLPQDAEREMIEAAAKNLLENVELKFARSTEYHLGPGDVLGIALVGRPDIFGTDKTGAERITVTVTEDPIITLPLIGAVKVHGKTSRQLEEELRIAYARFIANPIPVVTVEKYYYNQVSVLGAVASSGKVPLDFGDTLIDVIFKAGGLSFGSANSGLPPARVLKIYREKVANKERFELTADELLARITEEDGTINPRTEIVVPIEDFILSGELDYNIPMLPNDIVYVPTAGTVIVHGRAKHPGIVFLGPSLRTISQVITERGGLRYSASSWCEVVRTYNDGTQESFFLHTRRILRRYDQDFYVQDGDEVFLYTHPTRDILEFLGNLFRTGTTTGLKATYGPFGA